MLVRLSPAARLSVVPSMLGPLADTDTTARLLERFAAAITAHDWPGLTAVLAPGATVTLLHTGETFDRDAFVTFNSGYPGPWVYTADEVVDGGARAVLRAHVTSDDGTYHCASFATSAGGLLTDLLEVWTEAVAPHPTRG